MPGIVTRRPLVLQLHKTEDHREYAEFLHQPGKKYTDWGEIKSHQICILVKDAGTFCFITPFLILHPLTEIIIFKISR